MVGVQHHNDSRKAVHSPVPITKQQQQQLINYYTFFIVFTFVVVVVPSGEAHCVNPGGEESG